MVFFVRLYTAVDKISTDIARCKVPLRLMKIVFLVSSGTGSPGWSRKKGRKTVVVVVVVCDKMNQCNMLCTSGFMDDAMWPSGPHVGYSQSMPHSLIAFTITWPHIHRAHCTSQCCCERGPEVCYTRLPSLEFSFYVPKSLNFYRAFKRYINTNEMW